MPKKKQTDSDSSLIISRVQREAREGKGETRNTVIRSRVIHGDDAVDAGETKAARKSARKPARSTVSPRSNARPSRAKRTTPDTPPATTPET